MLLTSQAAGRVVELQDEGDTLVTVVIACSAQKAAISDRICSQPVINAAD
jgi:hypothetical protein